jgi:hypothetical protein
MVDFPEGYGFAPGKGRALMQETFTVVLGTFSHRPHWSPYYKTGPRKSPYEFTEIGVIQKEANDAPIRGILLQVDTPPIEGTLQQVVTALCTIHRMRGHMK